MKAPVLQLPRLFMFTAVLLVGCSKEPTVEVAQVAQTATGNRLVEAMATPEYARACEQTPGCIQVADMERMSGESLWRVHITRTAAGGIRIGQVDIVEVAAGDGVPVGPAYGDHALVGINGNGDIVDGQVIRFPDTLRIESVEPAGFEHIDLKGKEVDTLAYLRVSPAVVSLVVQDRDGAVMDSADVPMQDSSASLDPLSRFLGISPAWALTMPFQGLPPQCSHIIVLQGEEDRELAVGSQWESTARLGWPGPYQLAATQAALARLTPLLCQSVRRIAFAYVPDVDSVLAAVNSFGAGDLMMINISTLLSEEELETKLSRRLMLQATIAHEAGHAAETLLTVESSGNDRLLARNYSGSWGFPARTLANKTIENVRLEVGMEAEWQRMHESFVAVNWAKGYGNFPSERGDPPAWNPSDIVNAGFISQYASTNWAEDIADTVAYAYYSRIVGDAYEENDVGHLRGDFGCIEMNAYQEENLPSRLAALYTKLQFLKDLGLVHPEGVKECTGENLGVPRDAPGFHVWQEGSKKRSFQNQLAAHIGTRESGVPVFEMEGAGQAGFGDKTYPARVKLRLDLGNRFQDFDKVSWPRGVYDLGLTGNNNFSIRLDGAKAGNFDAMDGFVLVAESSAKRIAGSIVLQRVFRLSAPLPVPERYDPPLVVRFSMDK